MAIKLKKLNKDLISKNPYIKIVTLLLMVVFASLFFNTLLFLIRDHFALIRYTLEDLLNNYGWYGQTEVRKFIL